MPKNGTQKVPSVAAADLSDLIARIGAKIPPNSELEVVEYLSLGMSCIPPHNIRQMDVVFRATALFDALAYETDPLIEAKLLARSVEHGGALMYPQALVHAASVVPLRVRTTHNNIEMLYELTELIRIGQTQDTEVPQVMLTLPGFHAANVPASVIQFADLGDGTLGTALKNSMQGLPEEALPAFDLNDYPTYRKAIQCREQNLPKLAPHHAAQFTAIMPADYEPPGQLMRKALRAMPEPLQALLGGNSKNGPWSVHPMLDEGTQWSWPRYRAAALSHPDAARTPCLQGVYPITYFMRHGEVSDLQALIELSPECVTDRDADGRPLLFDLINRKGTEQTLDLCLQAGVSPNQHNPSESSQLGLAMRMRNHHAVKALLRAGYDDRQDPTLDRAAIDHYLAERVPPECRDPLEQMRGRLPQKSSATLVQDQLTALLGEAAKGTSRIYN